jgi:hypothetical protein
MGFSFRKLVKPVIGGLGGFALGGPIGALAGASLGASMDPGKPAMNNQRSGYAALPPQGQQAYNRYFDSLNSIPQDPYSTGRFSQVGAPQTPFDSEQLYALQQLMGEQGVNPVGVLEPFNEYQRNALSSYGSPDYTEEGLAQYMAPFRAARERAAMNVNRRFDNQNAEVRSREARIGSLARDRDYGGQTPAVEEARQRALIDAEMASLGNALGLRSNSLADMFNAGGRIQQQNQAGLNAASPQAINMQSPQYGFAQAYMPLQQGIANSQYSTQQGGRPSTLGQLGNLGTGVFGDWIQQSFNDYLGVRPRPNYS